MTVQAGLCQTWSETKLLASHAQAHFLVVLLLALDITLGGLGAEPILNPPGVGVPVGVNDGVPNPPGVPPAAESRRK